MNDQQSSHNPQTVSRVILVATSVVGGIALLATGVSAAVAVVGNGQPRWSVETIDEFAGDGDFESLDESSASLTADASGATGIDVDASSVALTVVVTPSPASRVNEPDAEEDGAAAYSEASLEVTGPGAERWTLERDGETLAVTSPDNVTNGQARATLTLPSDLAAKVDADISMNRGELKVDGALRDLDIDADMGEVMLAGAARSLDIDMKMGQFDAELTDVSSAAFDFTAAEATVKLTGTAPSSVEASVRFGEANIVLPAGEYLLERNGDAGDIDSQLSEAADATNEVSARAEFGTIVLRHAKP